MAKFNKDTFINEITSKVQAAIDKQVINREDVDSNDLDRLHGFIQFELIEYIEDRKFAIDVLKDFNYDEKTPWDKLQEEFGTFMRIFHYRLILHLQLLRKQYIQNMRVRLIMHQQPPLNLYMLDMHQLLIMYRLQL